MRDLYCMEIYKHFKGGYYYVLGVSTPTSDNSLRELFNPTNDCLFVATHTEKSGVPVYQDSEGDFMHSLAYEN
ncbi:hypothetical protein EXD82_02725 [Peptacetobacter hominis]|uniref:DUF1653 domain-containing protein n=1 Tax=Peptacetobacter hominis TaxID=2743610 RepID=A0A544QXD2_9FIRM|nr:DUF1653 domain-containing protein [Peptacetobacter hominis]TQQ85326.1 hypothetical protein EXD82_02725 [Peptacetobacter hominis]